MSTDDPRARPFETFVVGRGASTQYGYPEATRLWPGLSLREWYAGLALQGMVAYNDQAISVQGVVTEAVMYADALIKELEKK